MLSPSYETGIYPVPAIAVEVEVVQLRPNVIINLCLDESAPAVYDWAQRDKFKDSSPRSPFHDALLPVGMAWPK